MPISIVKPTVGADADTWGGKVNTALDVIVDEVNLNTTDIATKITDPGTATAAQSLVWNGTAWVAGSRPAIDDTTASASTVYSSTKTDAQIATAGSVKAPLASPALTGTPTAPTPAALDNTTKVATTAYTDTAVGVEATARASADTTLTTNVATKAPLLTSQTQQTGTTYTLVMGDAGTVVEGSNAAAQTFTVPPNSAVAFPVGAVIYLRQMGAGQITVAPGAAVTIRSRGPALKLTGQYAEASLMKRAADEWVLTGDISA